MAGLNIFNCFMYGFTSFSFNLPPYGAIFMRHIKHNEVYTKNGTAMGATAKHFIELAYSKSTILTMPVLTLSTATY